MSAMDRLRYWVKKRGGLQRFLEGERLREAGLRKCCDCLKEFPATGQYFSTRGNKHLHSECKSCSATRARRWRKKHLKLERQRKNRQPLRSAGRSVALGSDPLLVLQRITQGWD